MLALLFFFFCLHVATHRMTLQLQNLRDIEDSYTSADGSCNIRAFVRADDLYPHKSSDGQIRIIQSDGRCQVTDVRLELRLDEHFHGARATRHLTEALRQAELAESLRIKSETELALQFSQPIMATSDIDYFDSTNYTFQGEVSNIFSVSTSFPDLTQDDIILDFHVHMPETNFPAVDGGHRTGRSFYMPPEDDETEELKLGYTTMDSQYLYVLHGKVGAECFSILAGKTAFHPQSAETISRHLAKFANVHCTRFDSPIIGFGKGRIMTTSQHGIPMETFGIQDAECYATSPFFADRGITNVQSIVRFDRDSNVVVRGQEIKISVSLVDQRKRYLEGPFRIDARIGSRRSLREGLLSTPSHTKGSPITPMNNGIRHELSADGVSTANKTNTAYGSDSRDAIKFHLKKGQPADSLEMSIYVNDWALLNTDQSYQKIEHVLEFAVLDLSQHMAKPEDELHERNAKTESSQFPLNLDNTRKDDTETIRLQWSAPITVVSQEQSPDTIPYRAESALQPVLSSSTKRPSFTSRVSPSKRPISLVDLKLPRKSTDRGRFQWGGSFIPRLKMPDHIDFVGILYKEYQETLNLR